MSERVSRGAWALVVTWAKNVQTQYDRGVEWLPGFSYTREERDDIERFASQISGGEYGKLLLINALIFVVCAFAIAALPDLLFPSKIGAVVSYGSGAVMLLLALSVLFPCSLQVSALFVLRKRHPSEEVSVERLRSLHRKMLWQFLRIGIWGTLVVMGVAIVASAFDAQGRMLLGFTAEVAGPLVGLFTLWYLFSKRKAR